MVLKYISVQEISHRQTLTSTGGQQWELGYMPMYIIYIYELVNVQQIWQRFVKIAMITALLHNRSYMNYSATELSCQA
jgi:hypothetical protein